MLLCALQSLAYAKRLNQHTCFLKNAGHMATSATHSHEASCIRPETRFLPCELLRRPQLMDRMNSVHGLRAGLRAEKWLRVIKFPLLHLILQSLVISFYLF